MRSKALISTISLASTLSLILALTACSKAETAADSGVRRTTTMHEVNVGGIITSRDETVTEEPAGTTEAINEVEAPIQSGSLTAADYDDNLNPDLYAAYANKALQSGAPGDLPFVDTRTRVALRVVDAAGHPVPHARIDVARKHGPLTLLSASDGTASFYPVFDGVDQGAKIKVTSDAGAASRSVQFGKRNNQAVTLTVQGQAHAVSAMDLVVVLDATGSMGDEMDYLKTELDAIVARMKREAGNLDLRIGLIVYRDQGDDYVTRSFPLTSDIAAVRTGLARQEANGGGDTPEAVDRALIAAEDMQWRPNAAKALLLIADAPPHANALGTTLQVTQRLRSRGVQIVPVAASGVEDSAQYVMRTMAVLTQGRYIFLTDDSGIGNPHAEPDVTCYVVTRLDQLIARVLAGLVDGRRVEPGRNEIIRAVGDYDRGRCRGVQSVES
jgi:Mg-chelatase subunit ChlD